MFDETALESDVLPKCEGDEETGADYQAGDDVDVGGGVDCCVDYAGEEGG